MTKMTERARILIYEIAVEELRLDSNGDINEQTDIHKWLDILYEDLYDELNMKRLCFTKI